MSAPVSTIDRSAVEAYLDRFYTTRTTTPWASKSPRARKLLVRFVSERLTLEGRALIHTPAVGGPIRVTVDDITTGRLP